MNTKAVSVVIPTFNGLELLQENLASVFSALRSGDEVVIVDDTSTDGTVAWLCETYHLEKAASTADFDHWRGTVNKPVSFSLSVIKNHHNLRFGANSNRGVEQAKSPLVLLMNNDAQMHSDTISKLVPHFDNSQVFAVGCHEREGDQGAISGGKNRMWFSRGMFWHSRAEDFNTGETAWASGGSAMFDRSKWLELGGFDPVYYPAYWEDLDLSYRARQKGWLVLFEAEAMVDHTHETTNQDVFGQQKIDVMSWKNARAFTWRNGNLAQKISFLLWFPYYGFKQ